ncbi:MAG: hypothetical protein KF716_32000 [Anaerolineae bacterium]|nr:hypothetical protein [Anaerolineae bacterium]
MRNFLAAALGLFVVAVVASAGMIALGREQPALNHAQKREFAVCEGLPCFWEMIAGVTPYDDVREKVREYLITEGRVGRTPFSMPLVGVRGNLYWEPQTRLVTSIGLIKWRPHARNTLPMLLELIMLYGEPCAVQPYSNSVTLIFLHVWADFPREGGKLTFASRPETLVFENVDKELCGAPSNAFYPRVAWQGVATFDRYQ